MRVIAIVIDTKTNPGDKHEVVAGFDHKVQAQRMADRLNTQWFYERHPNKKGGFVAASPSEARVNTEGWEERYIVPNYYVPFDVDADKDFPASR